MSQRKRFDFVVLGAGGRGNGFSHWIAQNPDVGRVVAVAEPNPERRQRVAERHQIPPEKQFARWEDLLAQPRMADVVLNTTMDQLHVASAVKALSLGYHMMLEKPMAVTLEDCIAIDQARRRYNRIVSVCHSQRYHIVYLELKRLLREGAIGQLVTFDHIEGVEPVHQSHSFVRGNWGNESRSTFMLMAKSCHDLDLLAYFVDRKCLRVSSFGHLSHFRRENMPAGAPPRCTDGCPHENSCSYAAQKVYLNPKSSWARHAGINHELPYEQQLEQLRNSPYSKCVYQTDNDVVDHQVVNFEFEGPVTGTFTMTAFDTHGRRTRLHGSEGTLEASVEDNTIHWVRFRDRAVQTIKLTPQAGGHGGADENLMHDFIDAMRADDPGRVLTGTAQSLESHMIVFAAERARREGRVVELAELTSLAHV